MLSQLSFLDLSNATSSPGSEPGPSLSDAPDGPMTAPSGPDPVLASLSARQAKERGLLTSGTFGPHGATSSASVSLRTSLANRLRAVTDTVGSILFKLTWKREATPSGQWFFLLRASGRRTAATEFSSWPTPTANDGKGGLQIPPGRQGGMALKSTALLASWNSPTCPSRTADGHQAGNNRFVTSVTDLVAPWSTLRANKRGFPDAHGSQEAPSGAMPTGSPAEMENSGPLSPEHSRWLMGFPAEWTSYAPTETRSSSKRRKQ